MHVILPADAKALKAADAELNRVYRKDVQDFISEYSGRLNDVELREWHDSYRTAINDYSQFAKKAQRHWIKYRDLWTELAISLYRSRKTKDDPATDIKTLLTTIRVEELRNDPVIADN